MKTPPSRPSQADAPDSCAAPRPKRRQLVVGAGVATGAALAAATLGQQGEGPATVAKAPDSTTAEGYRLTDHIRRYYETTRT